jgi:hypothetical protein
MVRYRIDICGRRAPSDKILNVGQDANAIGDAAIRRRGNTDAAICPLAQRLQFAIRHRLIIDALRFFGNRPKPQKILVRFIGTGFQQTRQYQHTHYY